VDLAIVAARAAVATLDLDVQAARDAIQVLPRGCFHHSMIKPDVPF
jgi:hypothetical protein